MMLILLPVLLFLNVAYASAELKYHPFERLHKRQYNCASQGQKSCGGGCINISWTCCPDLNGGCSPSQECQKGSNGKYGCCLKGEDCVGNGGARTDINLGAISTKPSPSQPTSSTSGGTIFTNKDGCLLSETACGSYCIPLTYKCCPDQQGGCPLLQTCVLGSNNQYGCCPIGKRCRGDGGVEDIGLSGSSSSSGGDSFSSRTSLSSPTSSSSEDIFNNFSSTSSSRSTPISTSSSRPLSGGGAATSGLNSGASASGASRLSTAEVLTCSILSLIIGLGFVLV